MILHTFLEYENGQFKTLKKFLHYTGSNTEVNEKNKDSDALCEVHTITIITKEMKAQNIAYEFARTQKLQLIESYDCTNNEQLVYKNVSQISTVPDIDKTTHGINMLSNWLYPKKYKEYSIYRLDYLITDKMKYNKQVNYSINESRDEIIYSLNEKVRKQIVAN